VETGFPSENAITQKRLERIEFPWKLNALRDRPGDPLERRAQMQ